MCRRTSPFASQPLYSVAIRLCALTMVLGLSFGATQAASAQNRNFLRPFDTSDCTVRAGALFLDLDSLPDNLLLSRGNLVPVLFTGAFDTDPAAGWEFGLNKGLNQHWSFDTRYSCIDSFSETLTASNLVNGAGVRFSNTVSGVLGAVLATHNTTYSADLESLDLMARRRVNDWLTISTGARYVRFDDRLTTLISGNIFTSSTVLTASNEMTGGQFGADVLLLQLNRLSVSAQGLTGVYHNDVDAGMILRNVATARSETDDTRTSFVGELEMKGKYMLRKHVYVEGGYRLLWLEGVALAPRQAILNPAPGTGPMRVINSSDSRLAQGGTVNLVFQF